MQDMTIKEFCQRHRISETKYFSLRKKGLGPRELVIGARSIRITQESDIEWQQRMAEYAVSQQARRERERQLELARAGAARSIASANHYNNQRRRLASDD